MSHAVMAATTTVVYHQTRYQGFIGWMMYHGKLAVRRAEAEVVAACPINLSAALVGRTATLLWRMVAALPRLPVDEARSMPRVVRSRPDALERRSNTLGRDDGSSSSGFDILDSSDGRD